MAPGKVRWGMIGCGDVTEVKSGPAFQKAANSELVAVMRRTGKLAEDYAKRHNVRNWYDNADALINDPEVDAVYIATPPSSHKDYTIKAAKAGKPVYVEKPMALNFAECNEMIAACKAANVPLYVAYYRRAQPKFIKIKELLESNKIGDVRFVSTTHYQKAAEDVKNKHNPPWRIKPELSGGGLFFDLGCHTLDILDFLLGPIKDVQGFASNQAGYYRAEDIVTGTYQFESGIHGVGSWCFSAYEDVELNEIIGSTGKITFSTFGPDPVLLTTVYGTEQWSFPPFQHVHQPLIERIVADLTRGFSQTPSTGLTGARTTWVMDKLVKSFGS
ncbi:Gfo/Idh/MocA family protein [Cytobacillus solani]|uniref:Oxidoreductase n=1 Tax=Cytobacillus solani TaxID=1637975 RepID=A0A0Q3QUD7_9BACI|nr:Gfo/Idh/MocA family oxidoreductase [Cytobacillus solani]KQL21681.1 oxidoreductase [Cytobacillus solani]